MSRRKQLKKHAANSANNPRGCVIDNEDNNASRGCDSIFSCCIEKSARTNNTAWDFPCDEYDYIVEKLVIKRVPIALFATSYDDYMSEDTERNDTKGTLPTCGSQRNNTKGDSQKTYPLVQAVNSSLFYTSLNSPGPPGFPTRPSNKTLRFSRAEDVFDDDALASTSGYNDHLTSRFRDAELLNKFTALHPNLKESERAPKDPCPLNATRSRRSLAEQISEIAATKESHYQRTTNRLVTTESVHAAQPETAKELSSMPAVEEIPTRDKAEANSSRYKIGSSSCFPFIWRSEGRDEEPATRAGESLHDVQDSSRPSKNQNFIVAPVQVHYTSPNLENIRKIMSEERNRIDGVSGNKRKLNNETLAKDTEKGTLEETSTAGNSEATEEPSLDNLAGTTLRWKIIIKHHPPGSPATSGTSKMNSQPILSKGLRDAIEARHRRDPASSKNNRGSRNKKKEQNS